MYLQRREDIEWADLGSQRVASVLRGITRVEAILERDMLTVQPLNSSTAQPLNRGGALMVAGDDIEEIGINDDDSWVTEDNEDEEQRGTEENEDFGLESQGLLDNELDFDDEGLGTEGSDLLEPSDRSQD